jgi:hypothetical protein
MNTMIKSSSGLLTFAGGGSKFIWNSSSKNAPLFRVMGAARGSLHKRGAFVVKLLSPAVPDIPELLLLLRSIS